MTNNLAKTIHKIAFCLLFIGTTCLAAKPEPITIDTLPDAIVAFYSQEDLNGIIQFFKKNKNNPIILEKLHAPLPVVHTTLNQTTYVEMLWRKTTWAQWEPIQQWFNEFEITPESLSNYGKTLSKFSTASRGACAEKVVLFLQKDVTIFEKINKDYLLDTLYSYATEEQRSKLREWVQKAYEFKGGPKLKFSIIQLLLLQNILPGWAYWTYKPEDWNNKYHTQSKPHFFENSASTFVLLKTASEEMRKTLVAVYKKEQAERTKGNYVFYHAQHWGLHYSADIYKQLWNVVHSDIVGDDFTFFRFNQQTTAYDNRRDCLFMNHALFGNSRRDGSCTVGYFMKNFSIHTIMFSAEDLFGNFKLSHYYAKYDEEFKNLEKLHQEASTHGNLMLISIPADKLTHVRPVWVGGTPRTVTVNGKSTGDTKAILDTLITNPKSIVDSDDIEYTMPLTTAYGLDPYNGPRVYSFNAADPEKLKAYETARDELFAKIKLDIETHKDDEPVVAPKTLWGLLGF